MPVPTTTADAKAALESYDYKLVTWAAFVAADDRPAGLLQRAEEIRAEILGGRLEDVFVVYDPMDDSDGFLLISESEDDAAIEARRWIEEGVPDEGPLATAAA